MASAWNRLATCTSVLAALAACGGPSGFDAGRDVVADRTVGTDAPRDAPADATAPMDTAEASVPDVAVPVDVADASDARTVIDAGADAPAVDASRDVVVATDAAGEGGSADGAPADGASAGDGGASGYTFASPLQVDLGAVLDVDTVASSAPTGQSYPPLVAMDGSGYDFFTAGVGATVSDASEGLPDDGFFPSDGDHPDAHLAFGDTSVAPNSVIINAPGGATTTTFAITPARFASVQLYLTSTEGDASVAVTLHYADATTSVGNFTVPDWFSASSVASPVFVVQSGLSRFSTSGDDHSGGAALYGVNVATSGAAALASVTVAVIAGTGRVVLYGATAY